MGIKGLLPFLKKIHEQVNIAQFKGCTVAIDAYCWLHKGAFSCAEKLALKEDTDQYVYYCMKYINYMLAKDIKPILVFDGCHLESKAGVEKTRRERRDLHRKRAAQFLREGKRNEAKECLQKCVDITPQMALRLMQACRDKGVDCIVAPYEADAQLAYLNLSGIAQVIITEDSDLLLFGCDKIIFKMDFFGNGTLIQKNRLNEALAVESGFYTFDKFRHMCILSGCDYLQNLPGIGLATANKVFKLARQGDIRLLLKKLSTYLKKNMTVTDEYVEDFIKAENTFLYQLVFDPLNRELKPLNPYPPELEGMELSYAGHAIPRQRAYQIALGNIDIYTHEVMAYFDPFTFVPKNPTTPKFRYQLSIWDQNYAVKSSSPCKEIQPSSLTDPADNNSIIARGRIAPKSRVIKLPQQTDDHESSTLKVTEISDVYKPKFSSPKKSAKKRIFDCINDQQEEMTLTKRGRSQNDFNNSDHDISFNDENDKSPVFKRSPVKQHKIKYDASNIGEEVFKEEKLVQSKEGSKQESSDIRQSRNIFAVAKAAKSNLKNDSSAVTQSKYFKGASPKPNAVNKSECNGEISELSAASSSLNTSGLKHKEMHASKKETPNPMSLREMFKNLKEKNAAQGEQSFSSRSSKETNSAERPASHSNESRLNNRKTPSAFSWCKFKMNSSSQKLRRKCPTSHPGGLSPSPVMNSSRDSFSELLMKDPDTPLNEHSSSMSNALSSSIDSSTNTSSTPANNPDVEETISTGICEKLSKFKQNMSTAPDLDLDVREIKSVSYKSFLKSMSSNGEASKEKNEGSESGFDEESPFPRNDGNEKPTKVFNVNVERPGNNVGSSQDDIVDLTLDVSQTSNVSDKSRSSSSSGRARCRVSGLSKRKSQGKKTEGSKTDASQKSIKDLFSKFAFKKESNPRPTSISTSYSIDSPQDLSDDNLSETPVSQSFNISDATAVRRQLLL